MPRRLGWIAFDQAGLPFCDSAGDAIMWPTMEDAMDVDAQMIDAHSPRRVGKCVPVVKADMRHRRAKKVSIA